ncbi:MAG: hypothetical protein Q8L34_00350 [Candidatus Woesearchaeota archaeon]|nr:hypothetical protein [Candidatus Woesearchaeota archaeon]
MGKEMRNEEYKSQKLPIFTKILIVMLCLVLISFAWKIYGPQTSNLIKSATLTCNDPYIKVGASCCLDLNKNKICDKDEGLSLALEQKNTMETPVEELSINNALDLVTASTKDSTTGIQQEWEQSIEYSNPPDREKNPKGAIAWAMDLRGEKPICTQFDNYQPFEDFLRLMGIFLGNADPSQLEEDDKFYQKEIIPFIQSVKNCDTNSKLIQINFGNVGGVQEEEVAYLIYFVLSDKTIDRDSLLQIPQERLQNIKVSIPVVIITKSRQVYMWRFGT